MSDFSSLSSIQAGRDPNYTSDGYSENCETEEEGEIDTNQDKPTPELSIALLLQAHQDKFPHHNGVWLAEQLGIHKTWAYRIIGGGYKPDAEICQKLAPILGQPVELLLKLAGHLPPGLRLSSEAELESVMLDPELVFLFRQIEELEPEEQAALLEVVRVEIAKIQQRQLSRRAVNQNPCFARQLLSPDLFYNKYNH